MTYPLVDHRSLTCKQRSSCAHTICSTCVNNIIIIVNFFIFARAKDVYYFIAAAAAAAACTVIEMSCTDNNVDKN